MAGAGADVAVEKTKIAADTGLPVGVVNLAAGKLAKSKLGLADKTTVRVTEAGMAKAKDGADEDAILLRKMQASAADPDAFGKEELARMKQRKAIKVEKEVFYTIDKGPEYQPTRAKLQAELTAEMLRTEAWKELKFKPLKLEALGKLTSGASGSLHPLLQMREQFREILLEMGFEEMPTNRWVESSFWNFDALFQPQQHPARDLHDTFYLRDPKECVRLPPADYVERTKEAHQSGGESGSRGYAYPWQESEAKKNILRTHTTAVSSRMLYQLAQEQKAAQEKGLPFRPRKFFSIDRVFRNETLDRTHLAEFHQVEGLVADYDLGLAQLIATIAQFFAKFGLRGLRFKPAYNPYTEPSLEIFARHPAFPDWVEVGNSGVFRPEMLRPMGLPPRVSVIAWGLSLERPTMIAYQIDNIRLLFGADLEQLAERAGKMPILNLYSTPLEKAADSDEPLTVASLEAA